MRFHVVSLPHTQTTWAYQACAFTAKVINFCKMMTSLGHEVFLYSGEQNEAPCKEHIPCITETERMMACGGRHFVHAPFGPQYPHWQLFNEHAARAIQERYQERDFICVIGGAAHKPIADALPYAVTVEFGIGYGGTFAPYRVFESYAWMHTVYGAQGGPNPNAAKGDFWFDAVIPGYFEVEKFPFVGRGLSQDTGKPWCRLRDEDVHEDIADRLKTHRCGCNSCRIRAGYPPYKSYYLFVGRLGAGKGEDIAAEVCMELGKPLVVAGQGNPPPGTIYKGIINAEQRGILMAGARAVFVPSVYIEPFGNVAVEAQSSGTPVLATDWGAMTETVIHGVTGWRCRTFGEFKRAARAWHTLDPVAIRQHAINRYSLPVIAKEYERYFVRLMNLWEKGWYEGSSLH